MRKEDGDAANGEPAKLSALIQWVARTNLV